MVSKRTWGIVVLALDALFIMDAMYISLRFITSMIANYGAIIINPGTIGFFIGAWIIPAIFTYLGIKWVRQKK